jgi:glycosyltransferase involved in cell wall biosynthesis
MKILHLNVTDDPFQSGANRAMHRLHVALRQRGVQSSIYCGTKTTLDPHAVEIPSFGPWGRKVEIRLGEWARREGLNCLGGIRTFRALSHDIIQNTDFLHVHDIHDENFSYAALPWLSRRVPMVYTLHDMWPLTGHCAQSFQCRRWRTGCGSCPLPDTYPKIERDRTRLEWNLKRLTFRMADVTFVAPSRWIESLAREGLTAPNDVVYIPHGINIDVFAPREKQAARRELGLPMDRIVVMFAAVKANNWNKGSDLLDASLNRLSVSLRDRITVLLVGEGGDQSIVSGGLPVVPLGRVRNDATMATAYAAADLFVHPTRAETFGLVAMEALACGTPVVSFNVGGIPETVRHEETGLLADPEDAEGLARHLARLILNPEERERMGKRGRNLVVTDFNFDLHVDRHLALYQQLLAAPETSAV